MEIDDVVLESLATGSTQAKSQLKVIQEASLSLTDDTLAYLTLFFYLTARLRLVSDTLEKRFSNEKAIELRAFVEKKAREDYDAISKLLDKGLY